MNEIMTDTAATAVLFLHAQTSLHPGSGTALGTVDLPVQRERHTQWPLIPGSALKGILRDRCREATKGRYENDRRRANEEDPELTTAFGPGKIGESSSHAGAVSITDARILAFPVRSLKGVFAWVTCPAVLGRLERDLALVGQGILEECPPLDEATHILAPSHSPVIVGQDRKVVLEEFEFTVTGEVPERLTSWIADHAFAPSDGFTSHRLRQHLLVLHDDDFTHFVRHATEVVARIGLDYEKKTVKTGALFYQEFLPPETIFYSLLFTQASRAGDYRKSARELMDYVQGHVPPGTLLQIGGDETIGKGLCTARLQTLSA